MTETAITIEQVLKRGLKLSWINGAGNYFSDEDASFLINGIEDAILNVTGNLWICTLADEKEG